jgi:hypothetical protein
MIYLALAIWGAAQPMYHLFPWLQQNGLDIAALLAAWQANIATTALFWDLAISAVALTVFVIAEVSVRRNWIALLAIPVTFLIGISCGLPLYLFLRTRPVG